ncbi:MAG: F-type H+-transporting ATPase subunit gamma [Planctomycetota bacterium]|jgi:F-type H+-transporting ATPase subunit gamma
MAGIRELRGRIKSIGSIKQITRAMEMVATTKLRKFQDRALASRPYTEEISGLVGHLASVLGSEVESRPLFQKGPGKKVAVLLVSSDRGLCGAYNSNIFRQYETWFRGLDEGLEVDHFVYGKKGYSFLKSRGRKIERLFVEPILEKVDYRAAARTASALAEAFLGGEYSEVRVIFSAFVSMGKFVPTWIDFLPIQSEALASQKLSSGAEEGTAATTGGDVILEPDAATIFDRLVPRYLETRIYNALIEAITSEYASRRMSMKNATDAAGDMQKELKAIYNRKRQEGITKDLLDIVGGAEAVK